jgi:uncharacterized protein YcbX
LTPVKSLGLRHPASVRVERFGAVGNRRFYLARPDGRLFNGAAHGPLVRITADYDPGSEELRLCLPDGAEVAGDGSDVGGRVQTMFGGRPVTCRAGRGPSADALSNYDGTAVLLVRPDEPGAANDSAPVTMVSTASADALAVRSGDSRARDARRFRMLFDLEGCSAHEEDGWNGRLLRLGGAVLRAGGPVPRCIITTHDPSTGRPDLDTLSAIAAYRGRPDGKHVELGIYADVLQAGTVGVGDHVEVVPR